MMIISEAQLSKILKPFVQKALLYKRRRLKFSKNMLLSKMRFLITPIAVLFLLQSCGPAKQNSSNTDKKLNAPELQGAEKWFSAWEFVSKEIYDIHTAKPVDFVFFDTAYVYSTSDISIPDGELIGGPAFFHQKLTWKKKLHQGQIKLPNGQLVPVGLMSFASPGANDPANAFFVMPLPGFWKKAGVESKNLDWRTLLRVYFCMSFLIPNRCKILEKNI